MVGLWTIRLLVQVHTHWLQFTLVRKGYDNHKCHNKNPKKEMRLGCEWRHARKRWAENLVILKKTLVEIRLWAGPGQSSWGLTVDDVGDSWFVSLSGRQLKLKYDHRVLQISTDRDLGVYGMRSAFVGSDSTVSIVKIVSPSPCVEKLKSRS